MSISKIRKAELEELADYIVTEEMDGSLPVDVAAIAESNGITFSLNDYEDYFDGLLEHEDGRFHIYINNRGKYSLNTPRLRFSFAHELCHFFIDEHRVVLESGTSLHHPSKYSFNQRNSVEQEADYFASCLLMPASLFAEKSKGTFSFEKLEALTRAFKSSLPATASRYMEYGSMPIAIVCAEKGMVKYNLFSEDFPYKVLKLNYDSKVPPLTCCGDYFINGVKCDGTEDVDAKEWFRTWDNLDGVRVHEHCVYQEQYARTLSVLWFD